MWRGRCLASRPRPHEWRMFDNTYGLNKPLSVQFLLYCEQLLHGNLGISYQLRQPVSTLIAQRLPRDAILLGLSTVLALIIGVPMGIYQALHHNRPGRRARRHLVHAVLGTGLHGSAAADRAALRAVPRLPARPSLAASPRSAGCSPNWKALVLPGRRAVDQQRGRLQPVHAVQAIQDAGRRTTSGWRGPRACRSGWCSPGTCCATRCCRSITILGLSLPDIVAGAVIAESIFNFPGMGLLFWQSALSPRLPGDARRRR